MSDDVRLVDMKATEAEAARLEVARQAAIAEIEQLTKHLCGRISVLEEQIATLTRERDERDDLIASLRIVLAAAEKRARGPTT